MITKEALEETLAKRIGRNAFDRLHSAAVAVAGLGGLGSHIAIMLARSGIGKLFLVDFDVVDISNLNRQAYRLIDVGKSKTEAMVNLLREVNPYTAVEAVQTRVTAENAKALFEAYPIVCEAFDVAEEKAMLVNTLLEQCPNTVVISGVGMAGYGSGNEIVTKRVMEHLYLCGDGYSDGCNGPGLIAPRVLLCAAHQGNMALRLILGETEA